MADVLSRAGCLVAIILLGYVLRRVGFFKREDFHLLSKIVIKITLTSAIISNFAGRSLDPTMLVMTVLGFGFGVVLILLALLLNRRRGAEQKAFAVLNMAGCNIGNFVVPFVSSFFTPAAVMATSLFDVGNSFICLGGAYSLAGSIKNGSGFHLRPILRSLCHSAPFIAYITMTVLCAVGLSLPSPVVELAGIIGNANTFLAMLMLGVGFQLESNPAQRSAIFHILGVRYGVGLALALLAWFVLPLPLPCRQAAVTLFLSPIASAAPAFTAQLKGDHGLASAINSLSILISIVLLTVAMVLMAL